MNALKHSSHKLLITLAASALLLTAAGPACADLICESAQTQCRTIFQNASTATMDCIPLSGSTQATASCWAAGNIWKCTGPMGEESIKAETFFDEAARCAKICGNSADCWK